GASHTKSIASQPRRGERSMSAATNGITAAKNMLTRDAYTNSAPALASAPAGIHFLICESLAHGRRSVGTKSSTSVGCSTCAAARPKSSRIERHQRSSSASWARSRDASSSEISPSACARLKSAENEPNAAASWRKRSSSFTDEDGTGEIEMRERG